MTEQLFDELVSQLVQQVKRTWEIKVEASGRHVHLSQKTIDELFSKDYQLTPVQELSQPGQYRYRERVSLIGPKGILENVAILGPPREQSQVELSKTDALKLGLRLPVKLSGDLANTPGIIIAVGEKVVSLPQGVIIAQRHLHVSAEDAQQHQLLTGQKVRVKMASQRPVIFEDVQVRVSSQFRSVLHIDYDEANACGFELGDLGTVLPSR